MLNKNKNLICLLFLLIIEKIHNIIRKGIHLFFFFKYIIVCFSKMCCDEHILRQLSRKYSLQKITISCLKKKRLIKQSLFLAVEFFCVHKLEDLTRRR